MDASVTASSTKPVDHACRWRITAASFFAAIALALGMIVIAVVNLQSLAGVYFFAVAGEGSVRMAHAFMCLGLIITCVLTVAPQKLAASPDGAQTNKKGTRAVRAVLVFALATPMWMAVGGYVVRRGTALYEVKGPARVLEIAAIRMNVVGSPVRLVLRPGEAAHLYVRSPQSDGTVLGMQAEGCEIQRLH